MRVSVSELSSQARQLIGKKKYDKAAELYKRLEQRQPKDPRWPQQLAEVYRRIGNQRPAVEAYSRAAVRYAERGFVVKSIALCKIILEIDPEHQTTQKTLAGLISETPQLKYKIDAHVGPPTERHKVLRRGGSARADRSAAKEASKSVRSAPREAAVNPIEIDAATAKHPHDDGDIEVTEETLDASDLVEVLSSEDVLEEIVDEGLLVTRVQDDTTRNPPPPPSAYDDMASSLEDVAIELDAADLEFVNPVEQADQGAITRGLRSAGPLNTLALRQVFKTQTGRASDTGLHFVALSPSIPLGTKKEKASGVGISDLPKTPLFSSLGPQALHWLIKRIDVRMFSEGETIIKQGVTGTEMFILAEGDVDIYDEGPPRRFLTRIGPGSFFGEIALLTDRPRSATVQAHNDVMALCIAREMITELIQRDANVLVVMLQFCRQRLISTQVARTGLSEEFPANECLRIAEYFKLVEVEPQTPLLCQGQTADAMYLILTGHAEVSHDPQMPPAAGGAAFSAQLGHGDFLGIYTLITGQPARATIETTETCWVLRLDRETFGLLVAGYPKILNLFGGMGRMRATIPGLPPRSFHLT